MILSIRTKKNFLNVKKRCNNSKKGGGGGNSHSYANYANLQEIQEIFNSLISSIQTILYSRSPCQKIICYCLMMEDDHNGDSEEDNKNENDTVKMKY